MGGVFLGCHTQSKSDNTKHRKIQYGGTTYYIAIMPEGDFFWHASYAAYKDGYGGSVIDFLLEDGTIESVKGPFSSSSFAYELHDAAKVTGFPGIANRVTMLVAGRNIHSYSAKGKPEIVFEEKTFVLGDWGSRIKPEWAELDVTVIGRSMDRLLGPKDVQEILAKRKQESNAVAN